MQESPPGQCPPLPACPQLFLYFSQDPGPQNSSQSLCWGEVRTREKPICTSLALPCSDRQIVPEKGRLDRKMTEIWESCASLSLTQQLSMCLEEAVGALS